MSFFGYVPPENPSRTAQQYFQPIPQSMGSVGISKPKPSVWSGIKSLLPGGIMSLATSGVQYLFDSLAAKKQRKIAKQQWDEMNTYNSPSAQLARFRAAGINPAYGNATMNNQAGSFSNASTTVARPVVPDFIPELSKYQSMRNAGIEENILRERLGKEKLNKIFLDYTLGIRESQEEAKLSNLLANYDSTVQRTNNMEKLGVIEYLLKTQEYSNKGVLNPIVQELQRIALSMADAGINNSDSTFLRNMLRKQKGSSSANDLFKYVIGDRAVGYGADVLKLAIPSGVLGNAWKATKPR